MSDSDYVDSYQPIIDGVNYAVYADPYSPKVLVSFQFFTAFWCGSSDRSSILGKILATAGVGSASSSLRAEREKIIAYLGIQFAAFSQACFH